MMNNSLVHSGHSLCNVEQYPTSRRIRFKLNSYDSVKKISDQLDSDMVLNRRNFNELSKIVRDSTSELESLSEFNVKAELKSLSKESALLERSLSRRGLLKRFMKSAKVFGLSDVQISDSIDYLEKSTGELDFNRMNGKISEFLLDSPYIHNRLRFFAVRKRWNFLYSPNAVSKRRALLLGRIEDSTRSLANVSDDFAVLSNMRSEFDRFVSGLKHLQSVDYIFGLYDNEMILQKRFTSYLNLNVNFFVRVLSDVDSVVQKFGLNKYFVVDSLDDDSLWLGAKSRYNAFDFKNRYADFTSNLKVVSFTQQLSSLLSNILDLNIITDEDLIHRVRIVIAFCVWLFEQDFSDTRSFAERQSAWVNDQLEKADRVEQSGGHIDSLIGGSARHKAFRKDI